MTTTVRLTAAALVAGAAAFVPMHLSAQAKPAAQMTEEQLIAKARGKA